VSPSLASLLGYDPTRVAELPARQRRALAGVALSSVPGILMLTVSAGYGTWAASDSPPLAGAAGLGAGAYLLNLLRVAVAGGGVAPQQPLAKVTSWMPRTVPLVMLGLLGFFFAQPLMLALLAKEHESTVDALRQELASRHTEALRRTALAASPRAELDGREMTPYANHLARSHFLLRRVQLTWERPLRAIPLSAAMVVLLVLPWVAAATLARAASQAYEAARWQANRAIIDAAHAETRQFETEALGRWPTFRGSRIELHEDAPYNTRPRAGAGLFEARHG
jgi:hypothetical protein